MAFFWGSFPWENPSINDDQWEISPQVGTFNKVVTCGETILQNPSSAEVLFKWSVLLQWHPGIKRKMGRSEMTTLICKSKNLLLTFQSFCVPFFTSPSFRRSRPSRWIWVRRRRFINSGLMYGHSNRWVKIWMRQFKWFKHLEYGHKGVIIPIDMIWYGLLGILIGIIHDMSYYVIMSHRVLFGGNSQVPVCCSVFGDSTLWCSTIWGKKLKCQEQDIHWCV